jgi:hypothetical protein
MIWAWVCAVHTCDIVLLSFQVSDIGSFTTLVCLLGTHWAPATGCVSADRTKIVQPCWHP